MIKINKVNTKNLINAIEKYGDEAVIGIDGANLEFASKITEVAKVKAPANLGALQISIQWRKITPMHYVVGTPLDYAPYIEFGTGTKVEIPAEFAKMASDAKRQPNKGNFEKGLESIKEWCKRKGIPVEAAYPIFLKILNVGIEPKPFMYPAYLEGKKSYNKEIRKVLKELNKRFNNG